MAKGKWKPGESGNPRGRGKGTPNKLTGEMREALAAILGNEIEQLPQMLDELNPGPRLEIIIKLLEFTLPRLKSTETTIEQKDQPGIELGQLSREQRQTWYELYNLAKIKTNGQEDVEQVKSNNHE